MTAAERTFTIDGPSGKLSIETRKFHNWVASVDLLGLGRISAIGRFEVEAVCELREKISRL